MNPISGGGSWSSGRAQKTYNEGNKTMLMNSSTISPPTITMANGRCESEPMSWDIAAGKSPKVATSMVIIMGRRRSAAPSFAASRGFMPRVRSWLIDVLDHDHADLDRYANQRQETQTGGN